jgi:hypothetical protein
MAEVVEANNIGDWAVTGRRWQGQIMGHDRIDHHDDRVRDQQKMILWQLLHVEHNRGSHGPASTDGAMMINTSCCPARTR